MSKTNMKQRQIHIQYHSSNRCVVCNNEDFTKYDWDTREVLQAHKLNHIHLNSKVIVFCNSCLQEVRSAIQN